MLASVFMGEKAALESFRLHFLHAERVDWDRLTSRGLFSNALRHDRVSMSVNGPMGGSFCAASVHHRLGDHPLMHTLTQGLTTRAMLKAVLVLLFPYSYNETIGSSDTPQRRQGTALHAEDSHRVVTRKSVVPAPTPTTRLRKSPHAPGIPQHSARPPLSNKRPSTSPVVARPINRGSGDAKMERVALDDVVPLDEVDGVLRLDPAQLLCHLFLPLSWTSRLQDATDPFPSTEVAMSMFRAARSLCQWTRWAMLQRGIWHCASTEDIEAYYVTNVVGPLHIAAPLMFPLPTESKALRFMALRDLGPLSVIAFIHMLSVFLTDTFELAFTKASIYNLRASVSSHDADDFVRTLDAWRFHDGEDHLKRLLANYPTIESLGQAAPEAIVEASQLMLPTEAHVDHLVREVTALPRRSYASISSVLLHASVPLGSVAAEHRAVRKKRADLQDAVLTGAQRTAKVALPPGICEAMLASPQEEEDGAVAHGLLKGDGPSCSSAAVDVWQRVAPRREASTTLESVLIERLLACAPTIGVARLLAHTTVAHRALQAMDVRSWRGARRPLQDFRPIKPFYTPTRRSASARSQAYASSAAQALQNDVAHMYDRNLRAIDRATRRVPMEPPRLVVACPTVDDMTLPRGDQLPSQLPNSVGVAASSEVNQATAAAGTPGQLSSSVRALMVFDTSELSTQIPPMQTLTRKAVFEWFYDGPPSAPCV